MLVNNQQLALDVVQSAARMMRTSLAHRLNEHGLYAGQDRIILSLAAQDGQSPGVLAKQLGVKPPTVTKTIARLQEQGFVTKRGSSKDQRQLHVFLTKNGRKAVELIKSAILETERDALSGFGQEEYNALLDMLNRVQTNLLNGRLATPLFRLEQSETDSL
ncbi:MarR family winged helix-turn-helix transcriptional regulator [Bartonella sp. LJL80]